MNQIIKYSNIVEEAYNHSSQLLLDTALQQVSAEKIAICEALKNSGNIKVPVVGDFSAGKSSLLNAYIGKGELLPVDITPETSVAYELYYGIDEHVELFRDGAKIDERKLNDIKSLSIRPGDIVKTYVKSDKIKELEIKGITLVDMPGIDSGIKEHNDAILNYINKGTAFILLVDCAGGGLRQSTISFLAELAQYNLKPAIIVSKCDKKPTSEINDITDYVAFQARKAVGSEVYVGKISAHNGNISDFITYIENLDVAQIVTEKFSKRILSYLDLQISSLKAQAKIYSSEIADADAQIAALEAEKKKAVHAIDSAQVGDTPEKSTQDVLDLVSATLMNHSSEIAQMAKDQEDASTINARILNYIRPVIVLAFREEGEQYAAAMNTVVDDVSSALQNNQLIDGNIFDNLVDTFHDEIAGGISIAAKALIAVPNVFVKALGWVLQLLGDKVPDLIKKIFGKSDEAVLLEITTKVENSIIPQIIERLRPEILQQITAQQQRIRQNVNNSVSSSIGNLQDAVVDSNGVSCKTDRQDKIAKIEEAIKAIIKLNSQL
jgi:GTPase SAR1 family protein